MLEYFSFVLADNTPVSKSFSVQPITYPVNTRTGYTIVGNPLTSSTAPATFDLVSNAYKVENNQRAANNWYIYVSASLSNPTASNCLVNGIQSYDALCNVYFNLLDSTLAPQTIDRVTIQPLYANVAFSGSFVLQDTMGLGVTAVYPGLTDRGAIRA